MRVILQKQISFWKKNYPIFNSHSVLSKYLFQLSTIRVFVFSRCFKYPFIWLLKNTTVVFLHLGFSLVFPWNVWLCVMFGRVDRFIDVFSSSIIINRSTLCMPACNYWTRPSVATLVNKQVHMYIYSFSFKCA